MKKKISKAVKTVLLLVCLTLMLTGCKKNDYSKAIGLYDEGSYEEALVIFENLGDYKDSSDYADECRKKIEELAEAANKDDKDDDGSAVVSDPDKEAESETSAEDDNDAKTDDSDKETDKSKDKKDDGSKDIDKEAETFNPYDLSVYTASNDAEAKDFAGKALINYMHPELGLVISENVGGGLLYNHVVEDHGLFLIYDVNKDGISEVFATSSENGECWNCLTTSDPFGKDYKITNYDPATSRMASVYGTPGMQRIEYFNVVDGRFISVENWYMEYDLESESFIKATLTTPGSTKEVSEDEFLDEFMKTLEFENLYIFTSVYPINAENVEKYLLKK